MSDNEYFPGAKRISSPHKNSMAHNRPTRKATFHREEGNSTAEQLAHYVVGKAVEYSIIVDGHGDVVQIYPVSAAARSLLNGGLDGGIGANRLGSRNVQLVATGWTARGWLSDKQRDKCREIALWLEKHHGIPAKHAGDGSRNLDRFLHRDGWFSHSEVPGNDHTDRPPNWDWLGSAGSGHKDQNKSQERHHGHHRDPHRHGAEQGAHSDDSHGGGDHREDRGDQKHKHHQKKGSRTPPTHPDEPHYLVLVSDHGKSTPLLNRDGDESGWTTDKSQATEYPHGHIKYEHVDEAIAWAHEHGLVVEKVLRAKPADHHPDHEHKRHHKPDGKKGSGKLTKNASTHWPTDKRTVERLKKVAEDLGVELRIVSGYRTYAEQARLYDGWIHHRPGFNLAAPPGKSNHNFGHAADTDVVKPDGTLVSIGNWPGARQALKKHGLVLSVASEAWHVDPKEIAHWANPPIP